MTTFTDRKIIAAESSLAVVATHAALTAGPRVMVQRRRRSNLPALRHSCSYLMTLVASDFLMLRVIEADAECLSVFGSAAVTA